MNLHEFHRDLRAKRSAALQRGVVAVVDVGTSKIACIVAEITSDSLGASLGDGGPLTNPSGIRVAGAALIQSRGVQFGEISAMQETEKAIRSVLAKAQKMAKVRVDYILACFSGANPESFSLCGNVALNGDPIAEADIARVLAACKAPAFGSGREPLHAQPLKFSVDHRPDLVDPRGQFGNRLSVDLHLLMVNRIAVENIYECVRKCGLELAGVASSAYASGISSLIEDEQELGAACVDIGAEITGISIFHKKHMIHAGAIRLGGNHVTWDIGSCFSISNGEAERLKTKYGGIYATHRDDREYCEFSPHSGDWSVGDSRLSRSELIGVIKPRVEEILEEVRTALDVAGFSQVPGQRIVITGGCSILPGIEDLARTVLGQHVRLGRPMLLKGLPESMTGSQFSSTVGMCIYSALPQDEWWDFPIPEKAQQNRSLLGALRWFGENW